MEHVVELASVGLGGRLDLTLEVGRRFLVGFRELQAVDEEADGVVVELLDLAHYHEGEQVDEGVSILAQNVVSLAPKVLEGLERGLLELFKVLVTLFKLDLFLLGEAHERFFDHCLG